MTLVICPECKLPFSARGGFDTVCLPCYKQTRGYELTKADDAHIRLAVETKELQERMNTYTTDVAKLRAQVVELQAKLTQTPTTAQGVQTKGVLTEAFLKTLISLCHPDKHANNEKALEATKILIALRGSR